LYSGGWETIWGGGQKINKFEYFRGLYMNMKFLVGQKGFKWRDKSIAMEAFYCKRTKNSGSACTYGCHDRGGQVNGWAVADSGGGEGLVGERDCGFLANLSPNNSK
jgi:hypothetical protein